MPTVKQVMNPSNQSFIVHWFNVGWTMTNDGQRRNMQQLNGELHKNISQTNMGHALEKAPIRCHLEFFVDDDTVAAKNGRNIQFVANARSADVIPRPLCRVEVAEMLVPFARWRRSTCRLSHGFGLWRRDDARPWSNDQRSMTLLLLLLTS